MHFSLKQFSPRDVLHARTSRVGSMMAMTPIEFTPLQLQLLQERL